MLIDWVWACLMTICLWLEVGGWARLFTRTMFQKAARGTLGTSLSYAVAFGLTAQVYFVLALLGRGSPGLHVALMVIGIVAFALPKSNAAPLAEPRLHLRLARYFSLLSWKRAALWLVLPVSWSFLRVLDALVPHNANGPLAHTLYASKHWLRSSGASGAQLDPLHPFGGLASVWEGLTYHLLIVIKALGPVQRTALVRTQVTAQLVHLTAGQLLVLFLLARLIHPFIRAGWDRLVHLEASVERRHQLGMASSVALPASFFFAWIACGPASASGILAANDWAAAMLVVASVSLALRAGDPVSAWLAGVLWSTGVAAHVTELYTLPAFLAVVALSQWGMQPTTGTKLLKTLARLAIGLALGLAPWLWRNVTQAGTYFHPSTDLTRLSTSQYLGWDADWSWAVKFLLLLGLPAIAYYLWRARGRPRATEAAVPALTLFAVIGLASEFAWGSVTASVGTALLCVAALGIEFLITFLIRTRLPDLGRSVPLAWLVVGLITVPLPVHLVWQHLPLAFRSADSYLSAYHHHFDVKLWANLHLPPTSHVAWTADNEFYYLEQPATSIRESNIVFAALARAPNPAERAHVLCDLGFDVLAWEERDHGPEAAGLASWLMITKNTVLHTGDGVTFFDLKCR